jgi:hypothetical protein
MRLTRLFAAAAVLALTVASAATPVAAEEPGTVTISGTFKMDAMWGTLGADLAGVYANGAEHTWTATLHGVTHQHVRSTTAWVSTLVSATSFDLQFSGPDAATLNAVFGGQGSSAGLSLESFYSGGIWWGSAWSLALPAAPGVYFEAYDDWAYSALSGLNGELPTDADGYPVLPSQLVASESHIGDSRSGTWGILFSYYDTLDLAGDLGSLIPPVPATIRIEDGSVAEGHRGSNQLVLAVRLTNRSNDVISVNFRTVDGTAISVGGKRTKADYGSLSGTVSFQPGETTMMISIPIKVDRTDEPNETFTVELSNPVGATIDDAVATATIVNDD